jgi:tape measure domain-containing protein
MATQIGEAVIKLTFDGKDIKASLNKVESEVEKSGKSAGSKWGGTWAVAAGNLIAKGVSKVASMVTSTMGKAIGRLDTLNNFPKVMTSLGYSAEEADKSISTMSDSLDGLPTSLDAMAGDVQKLAASMGNLADGEVNATSVGLALNDMFLAGGKGTEVASAAMEQFNQMLANGRVDMQSWRSMVNAAPGQMDQLAKSLVGATANQADLYKAMQEGTVTFDDFNAAIVKLDKEGGQGFASLQAQAEAATGGIATQIENVSNTMNKIVAAALAGNLEDMDKYINQLTNRVVALVPTLVQGFTGAFDVLMKALPGIIQQLLPVIMEGVTQIVMTLIQAVPMFIDLLTQSIPILVEGVMQVLNAMIQAFPTIIPQLIQAITNLIITIAQQLTRPDFLSLILQSALTLLMEIVKAIPQILVSLINALPEIISNIVSFLLDPANLAMIIEAAVQLFLGLVMAVPQILGALIGAFGKLVGNLWDGITSMFGEFASNFGNFIGDIFKGAINGVLTFIENFINAPIDLLNGFIGLINDAFGWLGVNIGTIPRINLPRLAEGGIVNSATAAIIGEDGQEAVLPLENNTDNWAGLLAQTLAVEMQEQSNTGGEINVYMTNQINNRLDAEEIGRVMMQSIRRAA